MADEFFPETMLETESEEGEGREESRTEELLRRLLEDNRAANEAVLRRVTEAPRGQPLQQDSLNPELEFSLEGLADPAVDPAAFHKGYVERARAAVSKALQATRTEAVSAAQRVVSDQDVLHRAEAMIRAHNPDADQELIGYAGTVIAGRLKSQGKDPMAELRSNTEAVAQDIADYIDELAQKLGGGRRQADAPAEGRTRGLIAPRGRAPAAPKQTRDAPEDPRAFMRELQAIQQKARIY